MDDETPMNVHKAIALGFCDGILIDEKQSAEVITEWFSEVYEPSFNSDLGGLEDD